MKMLKAVGLMTALLGPGSAGVAWAGTPVPDAPHALSDAQLAERGAGLAEMWCNACHVTGTGKTEDGMDASPPFESLAPMVKADPERFRSLLSAPHYPMRDITLSRDEISALLVYISTLKDRKN